MELPPDLVQRGYALIVRDHGGMFAVSPSWGCTRTHSNVDAVVWEARNLVRLFERWGRAKARGAAKGQREEVVNQEM